jgi:beta-N-acetylhexosaminidase
VLITDCLSMEALKGAPGERVAAALAAGCDIALLTQGGLPASEAAVRAARPLTAETLQRIARGERKRASLRVDALALHAEVEQIFREAGIA